MRQLPRAWTRQARQDVRNWGRPATVVTVAPRGQRGLHRSVGPAWRAWMAGSSRPDPRCRHRGPEGAAGEGHLDLQPAGPPRGRLCPSARKSPRALAPGRRRLQMSGLPLQHPGPFAARPRGLLCPPLTGQACAGRSRSPPRSFPISPAAPPPSPDARPGTQAEPAPSPRRLPERRRRRAQRRLRRRLQREEPGEPRSRGRGGADGGGADPPRLCAPGPASSAQGPPRTPPGQGPGSGSPVPVPLPSSALTLLRPSVPAADARAHRRVRAPASACVRPGPGRLGGRAHRVCVRRDTRAGR